EAILRHQAVVAVPLPAGDVVGVEGAGNVTVHLREGRGWRLRVRLRERQSATKDQHTQHRAAHHRGSPSDGQGAGFLSGWRQPRAVSMGAWTGATAESPARTVRRGEAAGINQG